ncbi:MAG: coniferyl-alcohol dehydrogenase [Parasphingorhabdus sp.]
MALVGKTIIVTGVASGIGAQTAKVLKEQGATVIGVDRNQASNNVDEFFLADLSTAASVDELIAELPQGANGLCNVAGLPPTAPAPIVLAVNLFGLKRLTEGLVPKLADGSSITNVASLAGNGWAASVPAIKAGLAFDMDEDDIEPFATTHEIVGPRSYFYSKEAVIVWTMVSRWTWRDRGIRMNTVSPGPVETPILADFIETLGERAEEDMKIMDRTGTPSDVAPVVAFLQSDASKWIRGTNIPCDGGMFSHIQCAQNDLL